MLCGQHLTRISAHLCPLPNEQMENFWDVLGGLAPGTNTTDVAFNSNPYEMLPVSPSYTHFLGSLTTPPCSEVPTYPRNDRCTENRVL